MFHYTNSIKNKKIDTYVYISCTNFDKNIKTIEKNFKFKFPKKFYAYFKGEMNKFTKFFIKDKMFIIGKINEKKCLFKDVDTILKKICYLIKNDKKIVNAQFFLIPIKEFIRQQVLRIVYYMYSFDKHKTKKTALKKSIYLCSVNKLKPLILNSINEAHIINDMRDMVNEPGNVMTSTNFVKFVKQNNKSLKIQILGKKQLEKEKMNLILSVNQGSLNEPYLLIVKWLPVKKQKPIVLVGKGVTFDTGGTNIKRGDFHDMKTDMTGASVVFSLLRLCALNKLKKNVICIIPLVENMVGSSATRPGDIVTSYSKQTVEIMDTDAEGRLIMADALSYSAKFNPSCVIDVATLTGQAGSIFNNLSIVIMGNNNTLLKTFENIGAFTNEKIWQLPMWSEYNKLLDSSVADIKNASKSGAGTILGGVFLSKFIPKKIKWMHVDIAGVSFFEHDVNVNGATGTSIISLFELLKGLKK
jgi:leucyl aminopeptidase